jgi:hypothetical protein
MYQLFLARCICLHPGRQGLLNKSLILLLTLVLLTQMVFPVTHSAYRWGYRINGKGSMYILESNITIENIGNYGVIAEYLRPEGVYAYGIMIAKDPDKEYPDIYVILGTQDHFFHLGVLKNMSFNYKLFIDLNKSKAILVYSNCSTREYKIQGHPLIKALYLSIFNITGRTSDYPRVSINSRIFVLNASIEIFNNNYCISNLRKYFIWKGLSYNITEIYYPKKITPQTTSISSKVSSKVTSYYGLHNLYMLLLIILTVIIAAIVIIVLIRSRRMQTYG